MKTKSVETRARALNHLIFGNLNDVKSKSRDNRNHSLNAGTSGTCGEKCKNADNNNKKTSSDEDDQVKTTPKCQLCKGSHWFTRCLDFKRLTVGQRRYFVHKKDLCANCLQPGHKVQDVSNYPHLRDIHKASIESDIGLLTGNDVPEALEPKEIRERKVGGPYAVRTIFGWIVNGPLDLKGSLCRTANIIRRDFELNKQFASFCDQEFSDSAYDKTTGMSKEDLHVISIMGQSIVLKEGYYQMALALENLSAPSSKQQTTCGSSFKAVATKIAKRSGTSFEVFLVHGQPSEKRSRPQSPTGKDESACRCSVVSASSSGLQPE